MQSIRYQLRAGRRSNLEMASLDLPDPRPHEVSIEVKSIGLNFADVFAIWGLYSATPKGVYTPGLEFSGIVRKVGGAVSEWKEGDEIMGVTRFGAYASHLNMDARYLIPLPTDWSFEEGAAYLVQVLTAWYGLVELGNIQPDANVLIHSAAGGVGIWANRIAKSFDAFTIGSVGNPTKVSFCKDEGYNEVIVRGRDFAKQLDQKLGKRELNLVMECIGGRILKESFEAMAPMGRLIVYGSARYASTGNRPNYPRLIWQYLTRPKIDPQSMTNINKSVMAFNLIWLFERVEIMHEILTKLKEHDLGKPVVGHSFAFSQMKEALHLFQTGKTVGKVVVNT